MWSGKANTKGAWAVGDKTSSSSLVLPGTGTGAESNRRIHVSISFTSCTTIVGVLSYACPVSTDHTVSLKKKSRVNFVSLINN